MSNLYSVMSQAAGESTSPSYEGSLGFSESLDTVSGENGVWSQRTVDISDYAWAQVYLVFHYTNGAAGFRGDIQLDDINLDGTTYGFESDVESFETTSGDPSTYDAVTWAALTTATSGSGKFLRDSGGTGSSNTGLAVGANSSTFYVYAETSSPANVLGYNFWLRSPLVTLSGSPTLTYYEAREGEHIGTLNVHFDVVE